MLLNSKKLSQSQKQAIIIINHTVIFILAYFTSYITNLVATIIAALYSQIPAVVYTGHINFKIFTHQWTTVSVITTYAAGPIACLLLGSAFYSFFNNYKEQRGLLKVYFLWGYLHSLNFFLGSLVAGTLVKSGFWYAVRYGVTTDGIPMVLAAVCLLVLIGVGIASAPGFLFACDSLTLMRFENREKMLISTVFMPWLAGSLIIIGLKLPDTQIYDILQYILLGLVLLPVYIMNQNILFSQNVRDPYKTQIAWGLIFSLGLVAALFVLLFRNGMSFNV